MNIEFIVFTPFSPIINNLNLFGLKWNHIFGFSWSRDLWSFVTWLLFCGKDKKISLVPRVKDEVDAARESCMEEECERVEAEIAKERVHNENRMLKVLIKLDRPFLTLSEIIVNKNDITYLFHVTEFVLRNSFCCEMILDRAKYGLYNHYLILQ